MSSENPKFKKMFKVVHQKEAPFLKWAVRDTGDEYWYAATTRNEARSLRAIMQAAYESGFRTARQNCQCLLLELEKKWTTELILRTDNMNGDLE